MIDVLQQPMVTAYLRELDAALAGLPPSMPAELAEQIKAHLIEALPPDSAEAAVAAVLTALGPARLVAAAAADTASVRSLPVPAHRRPILSRLAAWTRRLTMARRLTIAGLIVVTGLPSGALIYWQARGAPQIAVSTTGTIGQSGEPHWVTYRTGGPIPPHSYRWVRVLWRSYHCYLNGAGSSQGTSELLLRVRVG
jgi:hypothetical protein